MLQMPLRRIVGLLAITFFLAAALASSAQSLAPAATPAGAQERITLIGDSAATAILWYPDALSALQQGLDVQMQVAVCRRLTGTSCPYEGSSPPTLLQVVGEQGHDLAPTVVVVVGYNDFEQTFGRSVETSLAALRNAGVQRIVWATLRVAREPYLAMNDVLRATAQRHPELTVVDWNMYSRSHPEWFQDDGIHLFESGGIALATFLRAELARLDRMPPRIVSSTGRPPLAVVGHRYAWSVAVRGGVPPYQWSLESPLPPGVSLGTDGTIEGKPAKPGIWSIVVRVVDGTDRAALLRGQLIVRPATSRRPG